MTDTPKIPSDARNELVNHLVPELTIEVGECMLSHIRDAAETVAREYDPELGDDPNLAGFNVARRGKNMAAKDLASWDDAEISIRPAKGFTWDITVCGTRLHLYSAPSGLEAFQLVGGDRKADIVARSIEQLSLITEPGDRIQPGDLVLVYVRDHRGLRRAAFGVLHAEDEFEWMVKIYDADADGTLAEVSTERPKTGPSFRDRPEKDADISLKRPQEKRENL